MPDHDAAQREDKTEQMARESYMRWCARVGHTMLAQRGLPPRAAARMARDAVVAARVFERARGRMRPHPMR